MLSADKLKQTWDTQPDALISVLLRTLRDFGYVGLDAGTVRTSIAHYYDGTPANGVIDMFVHGWLKDGVS